MMIHLMSPCLDVINNFLIYLPYIFSVGNIKKNHQPTKSTISVEIRNII